MKLYGNVAICLVLFFGMLASSRSAEDTQHAVRNLHLPHVPGELLIKYFADTSPADQSRSLAKFGGEVKHQFRASGALLVQFPESLEGPDFYDIAIRIAQEPDVEYVEANSVIHAVEYPDDPLFPELWALRNSGQTGGTPGADINVTDAWAETTGSRDVVVAIIDTGVNYLHPDIAPNYWINPGETGLDENGEDRATNGIDDDGNGLIDDWRGWDFVNNNNDPMDDNSSAHGTHCAGTVGARGDDGFGVAGVAWNVSIVGIKFLSASGSGSLANAVKAVEYANSLNVDIQNNSWGGGGFSQVLNAAIEEARRLDILFVAAAGNSGSDNDGQPHYPSSYEGTNVLSVAATDHNDALATFSNWGMASVHVAAPGVDILSCAEGDGFRRLSGTSMATPHVAGLAALVKSKYPELGHGEIKARIMNGVDRLDHLRGKVLAGGRINAVNALEYDIIPPGQVKGLQVDAPTIDSIQLAWDMAGDDGDEGMASTYEIRYDAHPIANEEHWANAQMPIINYVGTESAPKARLSGFPFNFSGYLAVRAIDNVGNQGLISEPLAFGVAEVDVLYANDASSMNGVTAEDTWGLERDAGVQVFSDSPGGLYANNSNSSLIFDEMDFGRPEVMLSYKTKTDIERGYDFGFVEVSIDGGDTWSEVEKLTGKQSWHSRLLDLEPVLKGRSRFQLRFRLQTDYVVEADGWFLDEIQIIAQKT